MGFSLVLTCALDINLDAGVIMVNMHTAKIIGGRSSGDWTCVLCHVVFIIRFCFL